MLVEAVVGGVGRLCKAGVRGSIPLGSTTSDLQKQAGHQVEGRRYDTNGVAFSCHEKGGRLAQTRVRQSR